MGELGLNRGELLRLSPPGSSHLRGLNLSEEMWDRLGREGKATYVFHPGSKPSEAAAAYIEAGQRTGVHTAYKCRIRRRWFQVPIVPPADLLLTCMNADTPRLVSNDAEAHHLNSVHGVYLVDEYREPGRTLLPVASLNSVTLLDAELVGRAYGGGILKIEPREADVWSMPSPALIQARASALHDVRPRVASLLQGGRLLAAVELVDQALLIDADHLSPDRIGSVRQARQELAGRRTARGSRAPVPATSDRSGRWARPEG